VTDTTTPTLTVGFGQNLGETRIFPHLAKGLWVTFGKTCLLTAASIMTLRSPTELTPYIYQKRISQERLVVRLGNRDGKRAHQRQTGHI
jgi:hypothetical protein